MSASTAAVREQLADPATQAYLNRIRERAEKKSLEQYPVYPAPRAAELPPEILQAQKLSRENVGVHEPYLQQAQALAQKPKTYKESYQDYMNPYIQSVSNRMKEEGVRTLKEEILPALDAKFSRLGHFGSSSHQKAAALAARDIQRDIAANQEKLLASGYSQGADIFHRDQSRQLESANQLAKLGLISQGARADDIKGLMESGNYARQFEQMKRDMAYQDFLRQQGYTWDQIAKLSNVVKDFPTPIQESAIGIQPQQPTMNTAGIMGRIAAPLLGMLMQQPQQSALEQQREMLRAQGLI